MIAKGNKAHVSHLRNLVRDIFVYKLEADREVMHQRGQGIAIPAALRNGWTEADAWADIELPAKDPVAFNKWLASQKPHDNNAYSKPGFPLGYAPIAATTKTVPEKRPDVIVHGQDKLAYHVEIRGGKTFLRNYAHEKKSSGLFALVGTVLDSKFRLRKTRNLAIKRTAKQRELATIDGPHSTSTDSEIPIEKLRILSVDHPATEDHVIGLNTLHEDVLQFTANDLQAYEDVTAASDFIGPGQQEMLHDLGIAPCGLCSTDLHADELEEK
uniref:Transposase n=1 Tax=Globodera pallida TaxID=36090 RepID=A0A183BUE9_GLOPA